MNPRIKILLVIIFSAKVWKDAAGQNPIKESKFRILAPEFICPKDEHQVVEKPDNTIITLQTADENLQIEWTVRWHPLKPAPAQRFTLMLWRTVRQLEKQLNKPPTEPFVYVIENNELLRGVNYIFNVSSIEPDGEISEPHTFNIDNTQGDQKLMIDGRNDMLSVLLVGAQIAYVDATFVIEALVTTCQPMQDYYFKWSIQALGSNESVDLSQIQGSRLEVPPCSLYPGLVYNVNCHVMRHNTHDLITLTSLPFSVQHRGIEAYLNVDYLEITKDQPFTIESTLINHDYCDNILIYEWQCTHDNESCSTQIFMENDTILYFPTGLSDLGEYHISLIVSASKQNPTTANATVMVVEAALPVLQLSSLAKILNEGTVVTVVANATNLAPTCTLSWHLATEEYLTSLNLVTSNETCDDCQHGEALSDTVTIYSLEEQFLSELTDFTNDTEWRQMSASFSATAARARMVAECGCSLTFSCNTMGAVNADIWFTLNEGPKTKDVMISPELGTALETVFRISTLSAIDEDTPLLYSFYCTAGEDSILLASYIEHRAVETLLPYSKSGIEVWVKVCDALGACSKGRPKAVALGPGEGRTMGELMSDADAHARRCELVLLMRVTQSAIITYSNTGQKEALTKFENSLQDSLSAMDDKCITKYYDQYSELLSWLANHGMETNNLPYSS